MKTLLTLMLVGLSMIATAQQKSTRCTAMVGNGQQCSEQTGIQTPKFDNPQVYCWVHSQKFIMWKRCKEEFGYNSCACDSMYGNSSFTTFRGALIVRNGQVYAYDGQ